MPRFQPSQYGAIGSSPWEAHPLPVLYPPYGPEAWKRFANPPTAVRPPSNIPGPIFMYPGYHEGPGVVAMNGPNIVPGGYGYGAEAPPKKPLSPALIAGAGIGALLIMSLSAASSYFFGKRYGTLGYVGGFIVPAVPSGYLLYSSVKS